MYNYVRQQGSTSNMVRVRAFNASTGQGITTLTHATANLTLHYKKATGAEVSITPADATIGTFTSGGFKHWRYGIYEVGVPDAAFTSTTEVEVVGGISSDADTIIIGAHIDLTAGDPFAAPETSAEIADAVNDGAWAMFKTLKRTGTSGNGGLSITTPSGADTTVLETNTSAEPIVEIDTGS